jgi:hypothetical protein
MLMRQRATPAHGAARVRVCALAQDVATYQQIFAEQAAAFHQAFYNPALPVSAVPARALAGAHARLNHPQGYADGAQTANAMALALDGVVPEHLQADVFNALVRCQPHPPVPSHRGAWRGALRDPPLRRQVKDIAAHGNHVTTGISGVRWLFPVLTKFNRTDLALLLASDTTYPSFGYTFMVRCGALWAWLWCDVLARWAAAVECI